MIKYDFNNLLEPYEFQYLVRDVLQVKENCIFESFSEGKDGGIDLRKKENDNTIIVQVKRCKDVKNLIYCLKNYELPKVKKLKPNRYIIATSVTLSKDQKQKIYNLFSNYIKDESDILSQKDLNNLLGKKEYHSIELNYPNLWFNSSNSFFNQIGNVVNSDIYEESREQYEDIKETMKYYVPISNFSSLISFVEKNRFLLITGNPGMGKTSLARALCAYFIQKQDYELIYTRSVQSANKVYKIDKKQIFFFDDFWGSCFKENDYNFIEERKLFEFINKISKSDDKLLILTSRDYVLKQGLLNNLELTDLFSKNNYILDLKEYSLKLRYMILLRHLYKSNLKFSYIDYIITHYEKIIKHSNFNPRIVEYYLNNDFYMEVKNYKYYEFFIENLDEPYSFLEQIYKKQSREAKLLLYLLLTINGPILLENLKELYLNALNVNLVRNCNLTNFDIQNVLEQLEKNFIKIKSVKNKGLVVDFVNYSIKDYLLEYWDQFDEFEQIIVSSITYFNQIEFFIRNKHNPISLKLTTNLKYKLYNTLIDNFDELLLIRSDFGESLEFDLMTKEQQLVYKIRRLILSKKLDSSLVEFILDKIEIVINSIKQNSYINIYEDDFASIIELIKYLCLNRNYDKREMIELYYNKCKYTYDLFLIKEFEDSFKEEYLEFIKDKQDIIDLKYDELIYKDLNYFVENKKYISLRDLLVLLENDLYYKVENNKKLQYQINCCEEYLDNYYYEIDEEMYYEEKYLDDSSEIRKFCPLLYSYDNGLEDYIETIKNRSKNILTNKQIVDLVDLIENNNNEYINFFTRDEKNIDLVILYYKQFNCFPKKVSEFCLNLINLIIVESNLNLKYMYNEIIDLGFKTFLRNEQVFTLDTLKYFEYDKNIEKILGTKLFISEDKWIKFVNPVLHAYCVSIAISKLNNDNKKDLYDEIIFSFSPYNQVDFDFECNFDFYFYKCLIEIDAKGFCNYFIYELISMLINYTNKNSEKKIINSIIKFFHLEVSVNIKNSLEIYSYSVINSEIWNLLNYIFEFKPLDELINKEAITDFKQLFSDYFKLSNMFDEYYININEVCEKREFYEWLKKYGLDKLIMDIYYKLKIICSYCKNNSVNSFNDFKKIVNNNIKIQI